MKMTMHIDEDILDEVMKVTGAGTKTKAVEIALKEMAQRARLKAVLAKGSGVPPAKLPGTLWPGYAESYRTDRELVLNEPKASYGKRRPRR